MKTHTQSALDYSRIEQAIYFLEENAGRQPDLKEVARTVGMSEYHFQRVFQRWAGISPKRFLQFLTKEHAKALLKKSSVLDVSLEAGLSGPGRLHDLFVSCEAMSPGEFKQQGRGLVISFGFHSSLFGRCFIAVTDRGICALHFLQEDKTSAVLESFRREWANAQIVEAPEATARYMDRIFSPTKSKTPLKVIVKGTNFQIKVWEALLRIPPGSVISYQTLAKWVGSPKAVRAVGNAVGKNAIAYLIPCHRVVRSLGDPGGYRWGTARKKAILGREMSQL